MELLAPYSGDPAGLAVWLIVATEEERIEAKSRKAAIVDTVRQLLAAGGYPAEAASGAIVHLGSIPEIEEAGGAFSYFR